MYLCYINKLGPNHRNELIYEFIFTNDIENVNGDDWDRFPASGYPGLPHSDFMSNVRLLKTSSLDLELAKDFNINYLTPGDNIIPDMWNDSFDPDLQAGPVHILYIGTDENGEFVNLQQQNGYDFAYDLEDINDYLKPEYKIVDSLYEAFEFLKSRKYDYSEFGNMYPLTRHALNKKYIEKMVPCKIALSMKIPVKHLTPQLLELGVKSVSLHRQIKSLITN
jgi:hypothetical protein